MINFEIDRGRPFDRLSAYHKIFQVKNYPRNKKVRMPLVAHIFFCVKCLIVIKCASPILDLIKK